MANETNATLTEAIEQATTLLDQKTAVAEKLVQTRQLCRLLVGSGLGSPEQIAWVNEYLPKKERATADERIANLQEQLTKATAKAAAKK
jgi:hypothetical protein